MVTFLLLQLLFLMIFLPIFICFEFVVTIISDANINILFIYPSNLIEFIILIFIHIFETNRTKLFNDMLEQFLEANINK